MRIAFSARLWALLIVASPALAATAATPNGPALPAVEILKYELAANQDVPELCFLLSETVARQPSMPLESYITIDRPVKISATPRNNRLCIAGLGFGGVYTVTLKAGLPGVTGILAKDAPFRITIPNRPPELGFAAPQNDILPRIGTEGLPIRSVNMPKIALEIFRITDRDLLLSPLRPQLNAITAQLGTERVWQGVIEPKGEVNRDTVTALRLDTTIGALKPGLYTAIAWPAGMQVVSTMPGVASPELATQYFTVSDLGLTAYRGAGSLLVAVRSLASAQALSGIDVALVARNNRELGRVRTDVNGLARFDPNLLRGTDGDRPAAIYAYGVAGEFSMLSVGNAGIEDQAQHPIATITADRSIHHPGDLANLSVLIRNDQGLAVTKLPLIVKIIRPDGVLFDSRLLSDQGGGSYSFNLSMPPSSGPSPAGIWHIEAYLDATGPMIGNTQFTVDRIAAGPIAVSVTADSAVIDPAQPGLIMVQGQLPQSGGAVANMPGELRITLSAAANPFPSFPGFSFGLAEEKFEPVRLDPVRFVTDVGGKAVLPLKFAALPKTTKPIEAHIAVKLFDASGRPTQHRIGIPIANQNMLLGVKPVSDPAYSQDPIFAEGSVAHFEAIAVSPDGARQEKTAAGWEIVREDFVPSWDWNGSRFAYRPKLKPTHVAGGIVDIPAGMPAGIDAALPVGRYQIQLFDPKSEAISSAYFNVGWGTTSAADLPDPMEIKPGKPFYGPGETADIFVKPPYESDVTLITGDRDIRDAIVQHVPAAGATLHFEFPRDVTSPFQLIATALAPAQAASFGLARRATASTELSPQPALHRLEISLTAPDKTAPQQTLLIPVTVTGAGDEAAFISLMATDELEAGTESRTAPDLSGGNRNRAIAAYGNYNRIITALGISDSAIPPINHPPAPAPVQDSLPDDQDIASISLYSGVVALDKSGKASIPLALPDFTGKLRLRAIAWSASRLGRADAVVNIHFPLQVELPLPAFLAPDDHAELALSIDNIDGPRGEYHIKLHAEGAIAAQDESEITANLAEHEQRTVPVALQAHGAGDGTVTLSVKGPNGINFERHLSLKVLATIPPVARHAALTLKPGATLAIDPALTAGLRPDSTTLSVSVSGGNAFDLRGLAQELAANDFGSVEQIIGAATPYLTPDPPFQTLGLTGGAHLESAVRRVLDHQQRVGGFKPAGSGESSLFLTAYAADFIGRAKAAGTAIPDAPFQQTLDFLALHAEPKTLPAANPKDAPAISQAALEESAYAQKILAANGRLTIFQLRYFADRLMPSMRTPLAIGAVAASYAALGDKDAAAVALAQALALTVDGGGPDLNEQAFLTTLMVESGAAPQALMTVQTGKTLAMAASHREFNVQEATWLFRAQSALTATMAGRVRLKAGDKAIDQTEPFTVSVTAPTALPPIKNTGDAPLRAAITVSGIPIQTEAKDGTGFELQRWFFDSAGKPIDPATSRQNDLIVVVLTGRFTGEGEPHPLLVDPLSAGWQVEATEITDPANRYPWLKDLTGASAAKIDDGRYIAAPVLTGEHREFKIAYVVRAAVRGQFAVPGSIIQDTVQPNLSARGVNSRTRIDPP